MTRSATLKSPFKTAAAAPEPAKPETGTTWLVDDDDEIAKDLGELKRLTAQQETIETKLDACKARLKAYADDRFIPLWAADGKMPEAPIKIACPTTGHKVGFVVQNKTVGYAPDADQYAQLCELIAPSRLAATMVDVSVYSFNPAILAKRVRDPSSIGRKTTVQRLVADRIAPLLVSLVANEDLSRTEADALLTVNVKQCFSGEFIAELPKLVGGDAGRLRRALTALGSAVVRFVKPT
jgi:hypothetical protein